MNTSTMQQNQLPVGYLIAGFAFLIIGLLGAMNVITVGHSAFNTSSVVPWGLPISAYLFFVLSSTGLTFVASLATVFGIKDFYPLAKRASWLALATLVAGFISLGLELGHPLRMIWVIPMNLQIRSPLFWMGLFYALYMMLLLWKITYLNRGDWNSTASKRIGIASFVMVIIAHGTLGLVFGMMAMRPYWYGGFTPVYFLASAALSGVSMITLFIYLAEGTNIDQQPAARQRLLGVYLPNILALMAGIVFLFTVFKLITGLWTNNPEVTLVTQALISSPLFWLEFWVGLVLPLVLLLNPGWRKQGKVQLFAAILLLVSLFVGRYEFVIGGQMVPLFKGTWYQDLISYAPSFTEMGLVLVGTGIGLLIYGFGLWKYQLKASPE